MRDGSFEKDEWVNFTVDGNAAFEKYSDKLAESYYLQALFLVNQALLKRGYRQDQFKDVDETLMHFKVISHHNLAELYERQALLARSGEHYRRAHEFILNLLLSNNSSQLYGSMLAIGRRTYSYWLGFYKRYQSKNLKKSRLQLADLDKQLVKKTESLFGMGTATTH